MHFFFKKIKDYALKCKAQERVFDRILVFSFGVAMVTLRVWLFTRPTWQPTLSRNNKLIVYFHLIQKIEDKLQQITGSLKGEKYDLATTEVQNSHFKLRTLPTVNQNEGFPRRIWNISYQLYIS